MRESDAECYAEGMSNTDPAVQVAEIRAILAAFDWEADNDPQYVLEAIDRIAGDAETEV